MENKTGYAAWLKSAVVASVYKMNFQGLLEIGKKFVVKCH